MSLSLRLRLAVLLARLVARPILARAGEPARARQVFERLSRLLPRPPHLLRLASSGAPPIHWISCRATRRDGVILYFHGGGYIAGSPATHEAMAARISRLTGFELACPAYRLAPGHPAPAAFDDARAAHAALIARGHAPGRILLGGDSAGGGLALALLADLCQRGLAPAGLFALSPWTDLALTGDSLRRNARRDPVFPAIRAPEAVALVQGALNPRDPRLSPLYARFPDPPPVLIQVGAEEILLDDSRRMAEVLRAGGGRVVLQEWPGCLHVWQILDGLVPEARQALQGVAGFVAPLIPPPHQTGGS